MVVDVSKLVTNRIYHSPGQHLAAGFKNEGNTTKIPHFHLVCNGNECVLWLPLKNAEKHISANLFAVCVTKADDDDAIADVDGDAMRCQG